MFLNKKSDGSEDFENTTFDPSTWHFSFSIFDFFGAVFTDVPRHAFGVLVTTIRERYTATAACCCCCCRDHVHTPGARGFLLLLHSWIECREAHLRPLLQHMWWTSVESSGGPHPTRLRLLSVCVFRFRCCCCWLWLWGGVCGWGGVIIERGLGQGRGGAARRGRRCALHMIASDSRTTLAPGA